MARGKHQEWLTDDALLRIESWASDGLTNEQIAEQAGVSRSSIVRYEQGISQRGGTFRKIIKTYKEVK